MEDRIGTEERSGQASSDPGPDHSVIHLLPQHQLVLPDESDATRLC